LTYKYAVVINGVLYTPFSVSRNRKVTPTVPVVKPAPPAQHSQAKESNHSPAINMGAPQYGALGATFTVVRGLQVISLISIIGMTANFIAMMVSVNTAPPNVLIGTLSVVSSPSSFHQPNAKSTIDLYCRIVLRHHLHPVL
jgi:hypothetical protein